MDWFNALPLQLQAWLLSASAETAGGLAADLAVDDVGLGVSLRGEIAAALGKLVPNAIPTVRDTALTALMQLAVHGSQTAENEFLAALANPKFLHHAMKVTGKRLKSKSCTEIRLAITAKLNDSDEDVRSAAVQALASLVDSDENLRHLLWPWLGWLIDRRYRSGLAEDDRVLRRRLADVYGPVLADDVALLDQIVALLDSPAWPARQGAAWAVLAMPGRPPPERLSKLHGLIDDEHSEESWPERLQVASLFVNDRDAELSRQAIDVTVQALDYATQPWYWMLQAGREVRKPAALILGQLEPVYRDEAVFQRLVRVLDEDADEEVRDAAYGALLRLAAAPEGE